MPFPTDIAEIVSRYKDSARGITEVFGFHGYTTFGAQTLSRTLDTNYTSTAETLRRLHQLQPGRFNLDDALNELTVYKTEQITAFVRDTPSPPPTTDTRKTDPRALDIIRGKRF